MRAALAVLALLVALPARAADPMAVVEAWNRFANSYNAEAETMVEAERSLRARPPWAVRTAERAPLWERALKQHERSAAELRRLIELEKE